MEWGRVGPSRAVRAEWGWGGFGNSITLRLGPGSRIGQVGPRGAGSGRPRGARVGPSRPQ